MESESFNLARYLLQGQHEIDGDQAALEFYESPSESPLVLSYTELRQRVQHLAESLLKENFPAGSRVFIRLPHGVDFAISFLAIVATGLVAVPVSPQLTSEEVFYLIKDSQPAMILDQPLQVSRSNQIAGVEYADTCAEDPAYLVYTSGTSGTARGVLHAHRSILGRKPMQRGWTGLDTGARLLHAGQLNWTYSLGVGMMDCLAVGATGMFYTGANKPEVWPALWQTSQASIFAAVPSLYRRILKYCDLTQFKLDSLKYGLTAGEALDIELLELWQSRTGLDLYEALGMSEISTYISSGPDTPILPGSPGCGQAGRTIKILSEETYQELPVDTEGLLAISVDDPGLMLGYWEPLSQTAVQPEANFQNDFFLGGDRASMDANGYIHYMGRADDMMNCQGYRVSPLEVERCLLKFEYIHDVGVRAIRTRAGVSIVAAFIILEKNAANFGENSTEAVQKAILKYAAEHLAFYKQPRHIEIVTALPLTTSGKLKRSALPDTLKAT